MNNHYGSDEDFTNKCGNCHGRLQDEDRYCRYCGTKRGEGAFLPRMSIMQCIYGPQPVRRVRRCTECYHTWETWLMLDNETHCPQCGKRSEIIHSDSPYDN